MSDLKRLRQPGRRHHGALSGTAAPMCGTKVLKQKSPKIEDAVLITSGRFFFFGPLLDEENIHQSHASLYEVMRKIPDASTISVYLSPVPVVSSAALSLNPSGALGLLHASATVKSSLFR
jgi:hypothetical protein